MNYSLPVGPSESTVVQQLPGNAIHNVTFKGAEARTIESKAGEKFEVLSLKFVGEDGAFEDTIFELKDGDDVRKKNSYGYDNPSALEELGFKIKHLVAAVAPANSAKIEANKGQMQFTSWNHLREFVIANTKVGVGVQTQIKLLERTDSKGTKRAVFPGFVLGITKENKIYPKTNFIGAKLAWNAKELEKINTTKSAKPSDPTTFEAPATSIHMNGGVEKLDLNFDLV